MNTVFLYITTVAIWGSTWIAIKYQLGDIAPLVSIAHRIALAALVMLLIILPARRLEAMPARDHVFVFAQGLCLFSCNYLLIYHAAATLTSGLVAVVFSTMLIMNILNGAIFLRLPVSPAVALGGLLGLLGMAGIFLPELSSLNLSDTTLRALLICTAGTLLASLGNIIAVRNHRRQLSVLTCNTWGMLYGSLTLYAVAVVRGDSLALAWNPAYLLSLLYLSLFGTVFAFWAYVTLIGRIGADRTSYTTLLFPVVALLLSTVFEGYQWTVWGLVGLLLVLSGNWIALRRGAV